MEPDKVKDVEALRYNDVDSSTDQAEQIESKEEEMEPEQKGLMFYHTDLYGSQGRLEIFPETKKEEQVQEQSDGHQDVHTAGADQTQMDLQKEVDELAKLYGLSEDKDSEELPFLKEPFNQVPTKPSVLHPVQTIPLPKQNTEENQEGERLKVMYSTDKHSQKEDVTEEVKTAPDTCSQSKDSKQVHEESVNPVPSDSGPEHTDVKHEIQEQLPVDSCADANSIGYTTGATDISHTDTSNQVNEGREEAPDIFCLVCKTPIRAFEKLFGIHKDHDVKEISAAVEDIKVRSDGIIYCASSISACILW